MNIRCTAFKVRHHAKEGLKPSTTFFFGGLVYCTYCTYTTIYIYMHANIPIWDNLGTLEVSGSVFNMPQIWVNNRGESLVLCPGCDERRFGNVVETDFQSPKFMQT